MNGVMNTPNYKEAKIRTKKGMTNFIIRDSGFISDPREYIIRSKYNQKVSDEYFQKKKRLEREQIKMNSEKLVNQAMLMLDDSKQKANMKKPIKLSYLDCLVNTIS